MSDLVSWQPSMWSAEAADDAWLEARLGAPPRRSRKGKKRRQAWRSPAEHRAPFERVKAPSGGPLRLIFCDFDGVLNRQRTGPYHLERDLVERLDRLAEASSAHLVVSSWWRWKGVAELRADLAAAGFQGRLIGRTPWLGADPQWDAWERGTEIQAVLDYLGQRVASFVILDDHDRMGDLLPYLVQTTATEGLTEADARAALDILSSATALARAPVPAIGGTNS